MGNPSYQDAFRVTLQPQMLSKPLTWVKPRTIFVNSMSDLFHDRVPDDYIAVVAEGMRMASWHIFQVLTKRSQRMRDLLSGKLRFMAELPNVWLGVSVENRKHGLPRIDHLRAAPARTRFLSIEPLLQDLGDLDLTDIHWVIVGGESGHGARPMQPAWVRSIRAACRRSKTPFFFKQWGAYGSDGVNRSKKANGRELDGRTYDEMPRRTVTKPASAAERRAMIAEVEASWGPKVR
jgi:protein gp37